MTFIMPDTQAKRTDTQQYATYAHKHMYPHMCKSRIWEWNCMMQPETPQPASLHTMSSHTQQECPLIKGFALLSTVTSEQAETDLSWHTMTARSADFPTFKIVWQIHIIFLFHFLRTEDKQFTQSWTIHVVKKGNVNITAEQ